MKPSSLWTRARALALLAATVACNPSRPVETLSGSASESSSVTEAGVTEATSTEAPTTGGGMTGGMTEAGACVFEAGADVCPQPCTHRECCLCEVGRQVTPADATGCTIAVGVVAEVCVFPVTGVRRDGQSLALGQSCDEAGAMWAQTVQDGDMIVELCGEACTTHLDGDFTELAIEMACEGA